MNTNTTATGAGASAAQIICTIHSPVDGRNRQTVWTLYSDGSAQTQEIARHCADAARRTQCAYEERHEAGSEIAALIRRMADAESLAEGYYRRAA